MVITITTYGTSLRKNNECIEITEPNGKVHTFPPHEVSALVLSVPCKFTSEIVSLCMEHNIYITMTDRRGVPLWHVEPFEGGSVPLLRRKQLLLSERREGVRPGQRTGQMADRKEEDMIWWVIYDIAGDKRLRRISKLCRRAGLRANPR